MIKANKIYNELSIYTENKIILWGGGFFGRQYLEKLRWFEIDVVAFCDNNSEIHGTEIDGVPVISPDELQEMLKENDDIVVQIACETDEEVLVRQLQNLGVVTYISKNDMEHNISYFKKYSDIDFDAKFPGNSDGNHIRLTKIDSEFSIYKNNKVILWGAGKFGRQILDLFRYHKLEVEAFCDNNEELHGTEVNGIKVISPDELKNIIDNGEDVVVQIAYGISNYISIQSYDDLYCVFKNIGVKNYIDYKEGENVLLCIERYRKIKRKLEIKCENQFWDIQKNRFSVLIELELEKYALKNHKDELILICCPPKTGDWTLNKTFIDAGVDYFNLMHNIKVINSLNLERYKNIKIVLGIREIIAQNLSIMYELLSQIGVAGSGLEYLMYTTYPFEIESVLSNGGDVQYIFDNTIKYLANNYTLLNVDNCVNAFCDNVVDIKKIPFNKEKGYTIVKEGNVEVFVYQLEKMNDIVKEMAEFVGGDFTEWAMGNVASDKWIADSYKQAQKEIKFSQEYFDKCFSESYVHHFYSDEDIEKFKTRWRPHIRENS